jgi:4-coumarate--CoA ligase
MPQRSPYPSLDIPKCNILTYLFGNTTSLPTKPLWISASNPTHNLSLSSMLTYVKRFAMGLDRLRIPQSRAIMVFCPNNLYVPMVYLAAAGSKRYFTGANPNYTVSEVAYQMRSVEAAVVLIHPSLLQTGLAAAKEAGIPFERIFQFSDAVNETSSEGIQDWRTILASESDSRHWKWDPLTGQAAIDQICAINFSSGTTGLPKGVCISHHALVSNASQASFIKFDTEHSKTPREKEIWLSMLPMYHAFSQLWTINVAAKNGIPVYVMEKFTLEDFLRYIERYKVTALQTVPPVVVMLSKREEVKRYDLSSIEYILCGAAPLKKEVQNDVMRKLGCVIVQGWGVSCSFLLFSLIWFSAGALAMRR